MIDSNTPISPFALNPRGSSGPSAPNAFKIEDCFGSSFNDSIVLASSFFTLSKVNSSNSNSSAFGFNTSSNNNSMDSSSVSMSVYFGSIKSTIALVMIVLPTRELVPLIMTLYKSQSFLDKVFFEGYFLEFSKSMLIKKDIYVMFSKVASLLKTISK